MPGFPAGMVALVVVAALVYFGLAHRVLDKLYLSDGAALAVVAAMAVGSFINIPLVQGRVDVAVNVGGAIIPVGLAIYVLARTGTGKELTRTLLATGVTAGVILVVNSFLGRGDPWETGADFIDPLYLYPLTAGIVAYAAGRSRRGSFVAAVLGVLVLDFIDLFRLTMAGVRGAVVFGGAGVFDVQVLAALFAVLLAEAIGELRERLQGGVAEENRPPSLLNALRWPRMGTAARKPGQGGDKE